MTAAIVLPQVLAERNCLRLYMLYILRYAMGPTSDNELHQKQVPILSPAELGCYIQLLPLTYPIFTHSH